MNKITTLILAALTLASTVSAALANPEGCNLYNKAGLPASPFRTDNK